jgi:hypothetical protein
LFGEKEKRERERECGELGIGEDLTKFTKIPTPEYIYIYIYIYIRYFETFDRI